MTGTPLKPDFIASLEGIDAFEGLAEALATTEPEVSVRINPRKGAIPAGAVTDGEVPWCPGGMYLADRPAFTFDPSLHQGRYYVQDASSMIVYPIVSELSRRLGDGPLTLLDACAAPGGKTLCAIDALPSGSAVVANEFDFRRAEILKENIIKWGVPLTAIVSRGDTRRFRRLRQTFDIIIVDAPCSGEGMMRKDATARSQWTPALVAECAARQREILNNVWPALRPGGYLVYSTCTFNTEEDEHIVSAFIAENDALPVSISLDCALPGVAGAIEPGVEALRFLPGRVRGEGLFVSVMQKPGNQAGTDTESGKSDKKNKGKNKGKNNGSGAVPCARETAAWLADGGAETNLVMRGDTIYGIPGSHTALYKALDRELDILHAGTEIATVKGRDAIPAHALALSPMLSADAFAHVEIDRDTTLKYLRRDTITLPEGTPRGYILLTHDNVPLGFVKNLGNRSNNLYPAPWRILSAIPREE